MTLWYDEEAHDGLRIGLKTRRTIYVEESEFQKISIVETERLGKALLLDDLWMTAEGDEKTYHEMLAQPAMVTAPSIRRVLVIGGGDGGTTREVLRHPEVEVCDLCEIDGQLIDAIKEHFPEIGAWDDPRLNVFARDGVDYVKHYDGEPYDVVLIDGFDPIGPGAALFEESFYSDLARITTPDAVVSTQSEDPNFYHQVHVDVVRRLRRVFGNAFPYYAGVMIYPCNTWSWTWASKSVDHLAVDAARLERVESWTDYYNGEIHRAAFAQPNTVKRSLK